MRLNRYVASASGLSRRQADQAISDGRVLVGTLPGALGQLVAPGEPVCLDGKVLHLPTTFRYIALNKPVGYVVSRRQQGKAPTIYDLEPTFASLRPVGRLDKDSSGLLLLSDDGVFIQAASHPSAGKLKVYELTLDRRFSDPDIQRLAGGIELEDGPSYVRLLACHGAELTVGLTEGRNRQLRRTFAALRYEVRRLHRVSFGALALTELAPGQWIECTERPAI